MPPDVEWPSQYEPGRSPIYAKNEIDAAASCEAVWNLLVHPRRWPEFYPHASDIHIEGSLDALALGTRFTWRTAGVVLTSTVRDYVLDQRLAWDALYQGSTAYHAWILTPTASGCHILTEETQQGSFWMARAAEHPGGLKKFHQEWIEALASRAADR